VHHRSLWGIMACPWMAGGRVTGYAGVCMGPILNLWWNMQMLWQDTMVATWANGNVDNSAVSTSTDQMGSAMVTLWTIHLLDGTGGCYLEGMTGLQVLYSRTHSQLWIHPRPKGVVRIKSRFPPPTQRHHCLPTYVHPTSNRLLSCLFLLPTLGSEPTQMQPFGPS
jgi:hypothetical protein